MTASSILAAEHGLAGHEGERLVAERGRALRGYGTRARRVELVLERRSSKLGLQRQFFAVTTAMIASFGQWGEPRGGQIRSAAISSYTESREDLAGGGGQC